MIHRATPSRRRFGQHFLHEKHAIKRIVDAFAPCPGEIIVEIGPGRGALTLELLCRTDEVHAVEIDRDLVEWLRSELSHPGLIIHQADALRFDFGALAKNSARLRIIGNLPYNISTPLLFHLLEFGEQIQDMCLMLQREVAERVSAVPRSKAYGRLTVMVQSHCEVRKLLILGSGAFTPAPKVESAVIQLIPLRTNRYGIADRPYFAELVRRAFAQRRKTVRNALKPLLDDACFDAAGVDGHLRPEQLGIEHYARLSAVRRDASRTQRESAL